jgi:hypothetical protein
MYRAEGSHTELGGLFEAGAKDEERGPMALHKRFDRRVGYVAPD